MTGGHLVIRRTLAQMQRRALWPGWRNDVRTSCQTYRRGKLPRIGALQLILVEEPFKRLNFDLTGPHPRTRRGSAYILTCLCPFSKWAEAFPVPNNKEAATIARVLVEQIICRFGAPVDGISDLGREVDGAVMREICRLLDVHKWRTSSYYPAGNGVLERFHCTLNSIIGRTISASQQEWDLLLPYVMAAYRASRREATGYSHNYLVMGREVRAPVDLVYGAPTIPHPISFDSYADELVHHLQTAHHIVREELKTAATRYKRQCDTRVKPRRFPVVSWAWYFNPRKHPGRQEKSEI